MTTTATSVSTHLVAHGTGSPEGVVTRGVGAIYVQEDASPGLAAFWYKATGSGNTGWVQIAVDTDGTLAGNSDLSLATQKAIKTYVDAKVAGLSWKQAVRAASTANVTLASGVENGDTLDGVTLATGDRILLKNQTSGSENGIYVVAASGTPARAADADSGAELVNATVYVSEGTTNADTAWTCTTNATITPGTTSLAFAQSGGGTPSGSAGGDLSGTYPNPAVAKITTTTGPTSLTVGAVADGEFLKRSGSSIVSAAVSSALALSQAIVRRSSNVSITNGAVTAVLWNAEDTDTDSYHDGSSNTDRLTAPATGTYHIWCTLVLENSGTGTLTVIVRKNGTATSARVARATAPADSAVGAASTVGVSISLTMNLTAADWISFDVYHNSSAAKNLIGNAAGSGEASMAGMRRVA